MPSLRPLCLWLLTLFWLGCATNEKPPVQMAWEAAELECEDPREDQCVFLACLGDACGFYRCEDSPGTFELARFPPARPPAAAASPGSPRRNWGAAQKLPPGAVMTFPNWNGAPERVVPPSRQLPTGRWEKHHIFPQERELREWFEAQGVKIHNYVLPLPYEVHQRIHRVGGRGGEWNEAWRQFKRQNAEAKPEEIFRHAGELIHRFQLIGGPIQPYYSRPGT
ncbi:TIGR02269 family lipoprotein [Myxococcus sp. MISCRS1]|uniref:SitA6 family polymorphic toxin lipoprotein n=1 Tax=unclassified Myxococcus TaxID=2648731 RepID=UPI0011414DEC|nr:MULTISPECIES: TIGR02269 family lipoprotein [unclassified Myxococcus]MCY1000245.1 TIGR02269 family lipoprotein [Myxococcus sp. MISCRS1]